jgi:hypothetical protein
MADATNTTNPPVLPLAQRMTDVFAEIADCIGSVQGALRHYQQPQDVHFHRALKACRDGTAAVREIERLRAALEEIRDEKTASYGVSNIARAALADGDA